MRATITGEVRATSSSCCVVHDCGAGRPAARVQRASATVGGAAQPGYEHDQRGAAGKEPDHAVRYGLSAALARIVVSVGVRVTF